MQDVIISLDEKSILDAIKKLGVKFEKNEDIRIYDQDNLMIIINFGKFNKFGVKRAKKDRGLIFNYTCTLDYGIRIITLLCSRYCPYVLSQYILKGSLT